MDVSRADTSHVAGDPLAARADSLVRAGHSWRATALLAPRLAAPPAAPAELRLVAARAAAGWEGWTEVERVLRDAPWLDAQFGGEGRELLARSELEGGKDAQANARLALADAGTDAARLLRRVLLARALDRADAQDSAASAYAAAAARLPEVADWLRLRAAGVTPDSAPRFALFAKVSGPVAHARVPFTDAQARERSGDFGGAARIYRSVGAVGSAFRVEALAARDRAAKLALARRILAYVGGKPNAAEARQSLDVLAKLAVNATRDETLVTARAEGDNGSAARAVAAFARAAASGPLSASDRYAYAAALAGAGRAADAAREYAHVTGDARLVPRAAYQRARALLQAGDGAAARAALRAVATTHATVSAAAAPALLLLADLQVDDGDISGAAKSLTELGRRYPGASQAPLARFRAGLIAWTRSASAAAATFDTLATRYPRDEEAIAAKYWAGRSYARAGKSAEAERRWREVIAASPMSYYAGLSARRLKSAGWSPPAGSGAAPHLAAVDSGMARVAILERLGMDVEARFELDALDDRVDRTISEAPAVAAALIAGGQPSRALRVAVRALNRTAPTASLLRSAYPVVDADALTAESRRNDLDPALVAGLIRQESSFNPHALSPAGARGLMQLMPTVGAAVAKSRGYPLWSSALLYDPDVSLELGTTHLASSMKRGAPPVRALAAYNAGASRLARWVLRPGSDDPELFAEWIPFTETRDYVRIVQRNAEIYRALYGLK